MRFTEPRDLSQIAAARARGPIANLSHQALLLIGKQRPLRGAAAQLEPAQVVGPPLQQRRDQRPAQCTGKQADAPPAPPPFHPPPPPPHPHPQPAPPPPATPAKRLSP